MKQLTKSQRAANFLQQNGVKIGNELHLKEGVRVNNLLHRPEYSERKTVLASTLNGLHTKPKVVSYLHPNEIN